MAPPSDPAVRAEVDRVAEDTARMEASVLAGRYDGIAADVERLEREARATGWDPLIAQVLYIAGWSLGYTGDMQASTAELREAAVTAGRARDDALAARALREVAFNLTDSGDPDQALQVVDDVEILASLYQVAGLRRIQGQTAEAITIFEDVLEARIAGTGEESEAVANVLDALGNAHLDASDLSAAEKYLERALAILAVAEGDPAARAAPMATRAVCLQREGKTDDARAELDDAMALLADGGDPQQIAETQQRLAEVTWMAGDHARAVELATGAADAYTRIGRTADHDRVRQWLAEHRLR